MDSHDAYKARLAETYRVELDTLGKRLGTVAKIVDTGGGCMAIGVPIEESPGGHSLELLVTTIDNGLAESRDDIVHWYGCVYDTADDSDAVADGHDTQSFDAAYELALTHLRGGVPASEDLCSCSRV
ncbi:hypothetical protein [Nocardia sp. NPDC004711]